MKRPGIFLFLIPAIAFGPRLAAQHYTALQGSVYAGGLGVHENPASAVSSPFPWDVTVAAVQVSSSSNAVNILNYSLLSTPYRSQYLLKNGNFARYADINANLNLLNARIALGRNQSIAFGVNTRAYGRALSSDYHFIDTLKNSGDFMLLNPLQVPLSGKLYQSAWIELYGSYARTLLDQPGRRLQAGITLKLSRGLSGAQASLQNIRFSQSAFTDTPLFNVTHAAWQYGYSANYDHWQRGSGFAENLSNFMRYTEGGASLDLGLEYLITSPVAAPVLERDSYYDYQWKFGLSLIDLGFNQYKYGRESRSGKGWNNIVTNLLLDEKFDSIGTVAAFNDSLSDIALSNRPLNGIFRIGNPARLILNTDHNLGNSLYVNANLSLNIGALLFGQKLRVTDMNRLTITPRWETRRLGLYFPIQLNTHRQVWAGLAFRAGPLLLGLHNLGHIFSSHSFPNGGGYLALIFRSPRQTARHYDKRLNCPPL